MSGADMARSEQDALDRRGSAAIEFGLLLPVFLMMLIGIIDAGRLIWTRSVLGYAVQDAARCAAVNANLCGTAAQIQAFAAAKAFGVIVAPAAFTVADAACGVEVSVSHTFEPALPWLFPDSPSFTAKACFPR